MPGDHFMALIKFSSGVKYLCRRVTGLIYQRRRFGKAYDQSHVDSLFTRVWASRYSDTRRGFDYHRSTRFWSFAQFCTRRHSEHFDTWRGVQNLWTKDRARNKPSRQFFFVEFQENSIEFILDLLLFAWDVRRGPLNKQHGHTLDRVSSSHRTNIAIFDCETCGTFLRSLWLLIHWNITNSYDGLSCLIVLCTHIYKYINIYIYMLKL